MSSAPPKRVFCGSSAVWMVDAWLTVRTHVDVLVLDDWGLSPLTQTQQEDLFQLLDDRIQKRSTIPTSQLPVEHWHQNMANPTIADALLDRLVQPAYRIELKGDSLRKQLAQPSS